MTLDDFFADFTESRPTFDILRAAIDALGQVEMRVSKSQVAFDRKRSFAWAWTPERYLRSRCAPLVLSLLLGERDDSPRWKEIVEPAPGRFMHHLELYSPADIDDEVHGWLQKAWEDAV